MDEWVDSKSTVVLEVPSVLVPRQKNYLINPEHPLFGSIQILDTAPIAATSVFRAVLIILKCS